MKDPAAIGFENAERACYDHLRGALSSTHNADSWCGEMPKAGIPFDAGRGWWYFAMAEDAADAPLDYEFNFTTPGGGGTEPLTLLPATFQGVWIDRSHAILAAKTIRSVLPIVQDSLEGVYRFRMRRERQIQRAVAKVAPDQEEGGEVRVWQLTIPMEVTFYE